MRTSCTKLLLPLGIFSALCAAGALWTWGLWHPGDKNFYALLGLAGVLALVPLVLWILQAQRDRASWDFLAELSALDALGSESATAALAKLSPQHPWHPLAAKLVKKLDDQRESAQTTQHIRASLELKAHRLRQEHEHFREVLEGLRDPVLVVDQFGELIYANPSAELSLLFEFEPGEGGAAHEKIACQPLIDALTEIRRRKVATERTVEFELPAEGGVLHSYKAVVRSLPMNNHTLERETTSFGAVALLHNMTSEKSAQKRHAEFVSAVSHEMKSPLAGIKAYVELLADGEAEDDATREEFVTVIQSQTERLQRLIDNLLNLARIEANVVQVQKQPRSLNELLEEAFHVVLPAAEAKNIKLSLDLSPLYLGVLADRDMLLQAAINLLGNAVKYTPEGGSVRLRSRCADSSVVFEVEDTGVGLSPEDSTRVFEKFYRVKKDRSMAQGTGLGLPLARHIVEDVHGGKLTVESVLGAGSTFRATIPGAEEITTHLVGPGSRGKDLA